MPSRLTRRFLAAARGIVAAGAVAVSVGAVGQEAIKLVVPFPPGGSTDRLARLVAPQLGVALGKAVVVENRPGADGTIGALHVARGQPDGTRLLLSNAALAAATAVLGYDFDAQRVLRPVIQLTSSSFFLVANSGLGVTDVRDLSHAARQRPGGLNCGGSGTALLGCEALGAATGFMQTIPYQGTAPSAKALLAGEIDLIIATRENLEVFSDSGRARVLAVASDTPADAPYDRLPLLKDAYPGIVLAGFNGVFVARGTPDSVVHQYNVELNRILALPEIRAALAASHYEIVGGTPEILGKLLRREIDAHGKRRAAVP